ncbi:hypothetical protein [Sphingomonas oligoaromativorans]|uniref:hypothetical protein n=1 Tax=Sphingomonas oligoaromativorans TaxID=575322 RepID=UPI0014239EFA|nr:hypothetical protein [Sphingomonas oligoaromativorans]NIJ35277.1 hypothetical protein [Sphingomonas oligoaromativorans]
MRKVRTVVLSGVAALAVAGAALAATRDMHVMKVGLPDGSVARIEYAGDVAPKVIVAPIEKAVRVNFFDAVDAAPFTAFDQIVASMDRNMDAMVHEIGALQPMLPSANGKIDLAALGKLPPGTVHYQFVSTSDGSGTCSLSVEATSYGPEQKPKIVSNSVGDCASTNRRPVPTRLDDPAGPAVPVVTKTGMTATAEPYRTTNII